MRLLKPRAKSHYKQDVELEVLARPNILIVYTPNGEVWFPHDVYRRFTSVDQIIALTVPYIDMRNAASDL